MKQQEQLQCDVLVVGGGAAGIGAAVGAARAGAGVVLTEKYGFLGGMATAGMVSTICGAYLRSTKGIARFAASGFAREFVEKLALRQQGAPVSLPNGLFILPFAPWHFVRLADEYMKECSINLLFHTCVQAAELDNSTVTEVACTSWNTALSIRPACIVDCTGEALMVARAGGERIQEKGQDPSVVFRLEGLHADTQSSRIALLRAVVHGAEKGELHADCRNISFVPGHTDDGSTLLTIPMASPEASSRTISDLEVHGRKLVEEVVRLLAANSYVDPSVTPHPAVQVGVRTGCLAKGEEVLTAAAVLSCAKNYQGVARGCWPIEIWHGGRKPEVTYLPENEYYDIPAGCLVADGLANVYMGGRCISAEERAMGSARVIGTALGTGYGAGTLAAFQAQNRNRSDAITLLREQQ